MLGECLLRAYTQKVVCLRHTLFLASHVHALDFDANSIFTPHSGAYAIVCIPRFACERPHSRAMDGKKEKKKNSHPSVCHSRCGYLIAENVHIHGDSLLPRKRRATGCGGMLPTSKN